MRIMRPDEALAFLKKGAAQIISEAELREKLAKMTFEAGEVEGFCQSGLIGNIVLGDEHAFERVGELAENRPGVGERAGL